MALPGVKPKEDRSQVRHRHPVAGWTEVERVPFEDGPELPPRANSNDAVTWAEAGIIPGEDWPEATKLWWRVVSRMPHAKLWEASDWAFAAMTAEVHARTCEGWKGYTGPELRQREKLLGVYADARRDLRIRYIEPAGQPSSAAAAGANVVSMNDYRDL